MMALAQSGAEEGSWLRAERQTSGRGRQGRAWDSPSGNLFASTLVRLRPDDPPPATLALVASLALYEAVSAFLPTDAHDELSLKWPNDLLLRLAKLSGILLERKDDAIVIGIGVNLASHPDSLDRVTISLSAYGPPPAPDIFLIELADRFADWVVSWRADGLDHIRTSWLKRAHAKGTALSVHDPSGERIDGSFDDITRDGALCLRLADGSVRVMHAGDVFLV
ncbi:biotin--[acetyl-CoA-carboxylase] ligase [Parasphingopyxis sp. CP4]|uniref:biotin--[acetyl-CoA-carboxylase] ligase n=1 Tax=Parasphingopyxis sp. CP4 TaxID=2724527 RepID=UPI00351A854A